jgi:DNA-binding FadR family transcriptional regulator
LFGRKDMPQTTRKSPNRRKKPLDSTPGSGAAILAEEIAILRVAIQRLNDLFTEGIEDRYEVMKVTEALGRTAARLAALTRTQHQIAGSGEDEIQKMINQALSEVVDELGIK